MTATVRFDKWENTASTKSVTMDQIAGGSGLVPVIPTSISVPSGTGTVDANGKISFSGTTAVGIDGVFTSKYSNYRLVLNLSATTTVTSVYFNYRSGGTINNTSAYATAGQVLRVSGAMAAFVSGGDNKHYLLEVASMNWGHAVADIANPQKAIRTSYTSNASGFNASNISSIYAGGLFDQTTQFDGIHVGVIGGTFSGELQVYGYR